MKTLAALMLAATSLCLFGCQEEKPAAPAKAATSAAPSANASAAPAMTAKAADTGGW